MDTPTDERTDLRFWRASFTDLADALFRELGAPPPDLSHEDDTPLSMEIEVDGLPFEFAHEPTERADELLVICRFTLGDVDNTVGALMSLLAANRDLIDGDASLGADPDDGSLVYVLRTRFDHLQATDLIDLAAGMATQIHTWIDERGSSMPAVREEPAADRSGGEPLVGSETFLELVDELCTRTGCRQVLIAMDGEQEAYAELELDGVTFTLRQGGGMQPDSVQLDCKFGALPDEPANSEAAVLNLLHLNRALVEMAPGAGFVLDREARAAVFSLRHRLPSSASPGRDVAASMWRLALQSEQWRAETQAVSSHGRGTAGLQGLSMRSHVSPR